MALTPGTRLGAYEITAQIGIGGMGEVYRATDSNLKRSVAIKVLPALVASDADRLARFQREAELLAALNHPNIAAIYGLEKTPDFTALVMELVEGDDLSQRIAKGAIPLDEALPIAKQIAEALEAAHEQGIIHRDLKPANIKVRPDGTVKVLDFGLAKELESVGSAQDLSNSPTITTPAMTHAGIILGTAAYMSPEQARGKVVDKRTDIWAFGCVLYEMLTGRPAFAGDTVTDILAAVVQREPDWRRLPNTTSSAVRHVMRRCLDKDPKQRLRDIGDARSDLTRQDDAEAMRGRGVLARSRSRMIVATLTGAAALAALAFTSGRWAAGHAADGTSARATMMAFTLSPPAGEEFGTYVLEPAPAPSPDGTRLMFMTGTGSSVRWWVKTADNAEPAPFAAAHGVERVAWAPDSQRIVFCQDQVLKIANLSGSPATPIAERCHLDFGATWGAGGQIIYTNMDDGLEQVSESGGAPTVLTTVDHAHGELGHWYPSFLPDGRQYVFLLEGTNREKRGIYLGALGSSAQTRIVADSARPVVVGSAGGRVDLVFVRKASLLAQQLDPDARRLVGESVILNDRMFMSIGRHDGAYGASPSVLAYRRGGSDRSELSWFARDGQRTATLDTGGDVEAGGFSLSEDEQTVLFGRFDPDTGAGATWSYDLRRNVTRPVLKDDVVSKESPVWMPGGRGFAFNSNETGMPQAHEWTFEGGERPAAPLPFAELVMDLSMDGRTLIVLRAAGTADPRPNIWAVPLGDRTQKPFAVVEGQFSKGAAQLSPDSRWLAFTSAEAGPVPDIYLQRFPSGTKIKVSRGGGFDPQWRRDGRELYYLTPDGTLSVVSIGSQDTPEIGMPRLLFRAPVGPLGGAFLGSRSHYVPSKDGQRFLVRVAGMPGPVIVKTNWAQSR